jgi:hypothetical protein
VTLPAGPTIPSALAQPGGKPSGVTFHSVFHFCSHWNGEQVKPPGDGTARPSGMTHRGVFQFARGEAGTALPLR